ncbi:hypothetical protein [Devosia nitrariae]|nr:hypothetical protein [Devosia nitrariae]
MRKPTSVRSLETFGRVRLSKSFFMRDFLYSEISAIHAIPNLPDDPDLAIAAGRRLCDELLEPLQERFGRISVRSSYRSPAVNRFGNENKLNCGSNESNYAVHIWDRRDAAGNMGATACIVVNSFIAYYERTGHWEALAWWVHDHLPYDHMQFFPHYAAFNLGWRDTPRRGIYSYIPPRRGWLTKRGMANADGDHSAEYAEMLREIECARA